MARSRFSSPLPVLSCGLLKGDLLPVSDCFSPHLSAVVVQVICFVYDCCKTTNSISGRGREDLVSDLPWECFVLKLRAAQHLFGSDRTFFINNRLVLSCAKSASKTSKKKFQYEKSSAIFLGRTDLKR